MPAAIKIHGFAWDGKFDLKQAKEISLYPLDFIRFDNVVEKSDLPSWIVDCSAGLNFKTAERKY